MTHTEAKAKFNLVEVPLTDMEVADRAKGSEDNFITVHVVQSFDDIVDLGRADDHNDPILERCFESGSAQDISYNIVGLIERPDHDGGNDVVVAVTCDVSDIISELYDEDDDLSCSKCGNPMVVNDDGTTNHLRYGVKGIGGGLTDIDHDQDADHAALDPNG